jgi:hypothetical protein
MKPSDLANFNSKTSYYNGVHLYKTWSHHATQITSLLCTPCLAWRYPNDPTKCSTWSNFPEKQWSIWVQNSTPQLIYPQSKIVSNPNHMDECSVILIGSSSSHSTISDSKNSQNWWSIGYKLELSILYMFPTNYINIWKNL